MQANYSVTAESVASETATKITRGHSCVLCQRRKVKCDRKKPCSNCIKARIECLQSAPTPRRRRKFTEQDLITRLRKYEYLLNKHGVNVDEEDGEGMEHHQRSNGPSPPQLNQSLSLEAPRNPRDERGRFFTDRGNTHYVVSSLWEDLRDEIQDSNNIHQSSSDDEVNETDLYTQSEMLLICHGGVAVKDLTKLHPEPVHVFRLWQAFLVNVDPLVKLFHAPTVQQAVLDASGDLQNVSRHFEALLFSIYFIAVTSMQPEECETIGDTKSNLLKRFSHGAQQALVNAKFMKSKNLTTLNALTLYLLAARTLYDPHSFWILTGTALRIAQRLGIHREAVDTQISQFDAEMRRRAWWQIRFLDGQASKLIGAGFPAWLASFDGKPPLNISDSDLSPDMKEPPVEREGATEMMFCSLRFAVAEFLRTSGQLSIDGWEMKVATGAEIMAAKDKAINELEALLHEKFVRYCDPSRPLHLLTIYVTKSVISTMRLMAHHPRQYPDNGASMSQSERDMLFEECMKELEISAFSKKFKAVQGFVWHIQIHFQFDAFIYVISELRNRTTGAQVELAWKQIETAYDQRPELLIETKNSLYFAIGNLTLKAWAKREESVSPFVPPPRFISVLRSQRIIPDPPTPLPTTDFRDPTAKYGPDQCSHTDGTSAAQRFQDTSQNNQDQWNISPYGIDTTMPDMAASDWEYFQAMLDGELPAYSGTDFGESGQYWRV